MNKTITMYDLLGLIKDGKTPKIRYNDSIYIFNETKCNYYKEENRSINWDYVALYCLNEEVEILDEEDEFIEITEIYDTHDYIETRINQLIHNQKILIENERR